MIFYKHFITLQYLIYSIYCNGEDKVYRSLVLTQEDCEFKFTKSFAYESNSYTSQFLVPERKKTYHFCPCTDTKNHEMKIQAALCYKKRIKWSKKTTDGNKCRNIIHSKLVKVENPNEIKNKWNNDNMEMYHSGFLIYTKDLDNKSIIDTVLNCVSTSGTDSARQTNSKPRYEQWNYDNEFITALTIYNDKNLGQTKAVEYDLLSIPEYEQIDEVQEYSYVDKPPLGTPHFYKYSKFDNDIEFLNRKIGKWEKYINKEKRQLGNLLSEVAFAPAQHFQVPLWQKAITIRSNLSLMWHQSTFQWNKMEKFVRFVSKRYGDLKITAGNTGIMSLPYAGDDLSQYIDGDRNKPRNVPLQDEGKITIPNYIWKIIEFYEDWRWYGILVIMHINIFTDQIENICDDICKSNGWLISNSDYTTGKMYCCEMTNNNIAKLDADFLMINKSLIFNLSKWEQKYNLVISDFSQEYKL